MSNLGKIIREDCDRKIKEIDWNEFHKAEEELRDTVIKNLENQQLIRRAKRGDPALRLYDSQDRPYIFLEMDLEGTYMDYIMNKRD
jgi:hypothetical protein